ncbi:endonuclease/exonuclease/phosphatase family protein [Vagococcus vulneris]|uniref:Endonuclease n=1 Tax=Vagococcus vulneris TaxID=1977869 RepID=A0A430A0G5_9ENTE|nr:endonuclease/exonuclease/phosphatase family protein [Vagococcus vulneris]RST99791.1 endonuclease [Vagococcus vulneris]
MKKYLKILGSFIGLIVLAAVGVVGFVTLTEYRPASIESLPVPNNSQKLQLGHSISLLTYNIGYGGLGSTETFFMDGGKTVQPESKKMVITNLSGIAKTLKQHQTDIVLMQEVDHLSKRSYMYNQEKYFQKELGKSSVFAYNFKVAYVPFPLPPIGRVESGVMTMTNYQIAEAKRLAMPTSFKWPVSTSNLKRALLETRIPIEGSSKELVVFNLHLDAYDNGAGKIAQSKMLADTLEKEYDKGNYVIAGGDFNQIFEGSRVFPKQYKKGWKPGHINHSDLPSSFRFAFADNYPTVRVLNAPYTGSYETSQVYVVDGFVVSDNLSVSKTEVINTDFKYTDHHPVKINLEFK